MFIPSFAFFQHLVFCSKASYESFPNFFKWLSNGRTNVVQNAVDLDRIDNVIKNVEEEPHFNQFEIVTVGLIRMKNPLTLLKAFQGSLDQSSKLVFLGEGSLRSLVTSEIERSGLENQISLSGTVERDRVFEYYSQADLFVSASWGEGLPVAVLEAMACRTPVLLSDIPPHREIAEGVDYIPLIKPNNVDGLTREIKKFNNMSGLERKIIGNKCREIVEERFSLDAMHAGYEEIYAQIINNHKV
jgi:glycosyltransferase involved in cell wall biosynthesis